MRRAGLVLALLVAVALLGGGSATVAAGARAEQAQDEPEAEPYPWRRRVASAARYAKARSGRVAFAVMDEDGRLRGYRRRDRYFSASTVKAMLMVTYLNQPSVRRRPLTSRDRALLVPMITRSDNTTASRIRDIVGNGALARLSRRAGMHNFRTAPIWGNTQITAADQARFFFRIDRYVVERHRDYARRLLSSVIPAQRWGMPPVRPRGFEIFFKGGWRPTGSGQLVHQIALFESGRRRISIAVLTDGNPSHSYGRETIRGTAARLLLRFR